MGLARARVAPPLCHSTGLRRGETARCRAGGSAGRAGPALHTGRGDSRHSELGKVLAGVAEPLRLAWGQRRAAGTVEPAAPHIPASLELVLPYPAHLYGDGGGLPAPLPGARHAHDRVAAGGTLPPGICRRPIFRRPRPLAGGRPLRAAERVAQGGIQICAHVQPLPQQAPARPMHGGDRPADQMGAANHQPYVHLSGQRPSQHACVVAARSRRRRSPPGAREAGRLDLGRRGGRCARRRREKRFVGQRLRAAGAGGGARVRRGSGRAAARRRLPARGTDHSQLRWVSRGLSKRSQGRLVLCRGMAWLAG